MKKLLILLSLSLLFFACSEKTDKEETMGKPATEPGEEDLRIAPGKVGPFNIGDPAPETGAHDWYTVENVQEMINEEGIDYEKNYFYAVRDSLRELRMEEEGGKIKEIEIMKGDYKTPKGIKVGSAIRQFINAYTDYEIWYSYVSEDFVIETPEHPKTLFILDPEGYKGEEEKLTKSDKVTLSLDEFNEDTEIIKIRIYR